MKKILTALLFGLLILSSCKKIGFEKNAELTGRHADLRNDFFKLPSDANPILRKIAEKLKAEDVRSPFIERFAEKEGMPLWANAVISYPQSRLSRDSSGSETQDTTIMIPVGIISTEIVNDIICVKFSELNIDIRLLKAVNYKDFGFGDNSVKPNAADVAKLFMIFQNNIFNHTAFRVTNFDLALAIFGDSTQANNSFIYIKPNPVTHDKFFYAGKAAAVATASGPTGLTPAQISWFNYYFAWSWSDLPPIPGPIGESGGGGTPVGGVDWNPFGVVTIYAVQNQINPNFPCLHAAFNNVTEQKLKNCLTQLYLETYLGENNVHNLEIVSGNLLDQNNVPTESKSRVKPNDPTTYQIALSEYFGHMYTQEYWSSVILHELVHGFVQKNPLGFTPNSSFNASHEIMLKAWVDEIVAALEEVYPSMSHTDAVNLSVNGFGDLFTDEVNSSFKSQMTQWMQNTYNTNATSIHNSVQAYQSGSKGTSCN